MKVLIIVVFFTIAYAVDFTCDPPCHSDQTCFGLPCQAEPCFGVCIAKPPMTTTLGSTSSKASTKPASTTPVSTTPASTTPASTTPASTTAAPSTTPKATTSLPPPFVCDPPCHSDQTCVGSPCQATPCFGVCIPF